MARKLRGARGGVIYHCLNRGNGRQRLFHKEADYAAFLRVLAEGQAQAQVDLLAFCLMPNHWHLVLEPRGDGDLEDFMRWISVTHVRRHHQHYHTRGGGHLYQGRYKSFPVQADRHLLTVLRYVEANARRARLVRRAQDWLWSSLVLREGTMDFAEFAPPKLSPWPVRRPADWTTIVNDVMSKSELEPLRTSNARGRPFGDAAWTARTASALGLESSLRPVGRPRKEEDGEK